MKTDYTRYRLSLMENIVFGMGYLVAAAVVCIIFYDSFLPLILMLPAGVYVRRLFEEYKRKRRQQELYFQFKDMVQALAASLSVGYSFENAFIAAHEELTRTYGKDALIVRELVVIMHEIRLHKKMFLRILENAPVFARSIIFPNWLLWQKGQAAIWYRS